MSTDNGQGSGGASPAHHDRDDALAPVISLHHHTDTSSADTDEDVPVCRRGRGRQYFH
ncbi:hypothetical protein [Pseudonocardia sp. Ae707_Ps2]|uniref:hypothetical protein n=1 Tax=Pseudonocardia sp. Ae707_Ps2 TaxID=2212992 RepID=UPI00307D8CE6